MTNKSIYLHLFIPKQRCSMMLLFSYQNVEHMSTTSGSGPHMLSKQFPTLTVRVLTYSGTSGERWSAMCAFLCPHIYRTFVPSDMQACALLPCLYLSSQNFTVPGESFRNFIFTYRVLTLVKHSIVSF